MGAWGAVSLLGLVILKKKTIDLIAHIFRIIVVPIFCEQDNFFGGQFWAMGRLNFLGGQSNLLGGQYPPSLPIIYLQVS